MPQSPETLIARLKMSGRDPDIDRDLLEFLSNVEIAPNWDRDFKLGMLAKGKANPEIFDAPIPQHDDKVNVAEKLLAFFSGFLTRETCNLFKIERFIAAGRMASLSNYGKLSAAACVSLFMDDKNLQKSAKEWFVALRLPVKRGQEGSMTWSVAQRIMGEDFDKCVTA
jgi:hypothetical protein